MDLRSRRKALGLSQSGLARMSGVSRFKICTFELGNGSLREDEQEKIRKALHAEANRLRNIPTEMNFGPLASQAECVGPNRACENGPRDSHER
jgi:predicted transcriptional regulator